MLVVPLHPIPNDLSLNWHSLNSGIQAVLGRALRLPRLDLNRDRDMVAWYVPYGSYVFVHMYVH